jgi:mannose-1-phosphate guanylyltransferase/phosphomannomutase
MVKMFDRPILSHLLEFLSKNDITQACLTLKFMPERIIDYFADAERYGVELCCRVEERALGTAGGVKNCAEFIGGDDTFLVISGDCVCDYDLRELAQLHTRADAEVTIALSAHPEPLEYGLVVTDASGKIESFVEKPAWESVVTDRANTGIYLLSRAILDDIPAGEPFDFGKDLFPKLLSDNRRLYGFTPRGYWCDVGGCEAYRQCCMDILGGAADVSLGAPETRQRVWSFTEIPHGVTIRPPVYIGRGVTLEPGAVIGPYAVIGEGSVVAKGAAVRESVLTAASVGGESDVTGAVLCEGASVGRQTRVCEGAVIGADSAVGDGCVVTKSARIWGGKRIPAGSNIRGAVTGGDTGADVTFTSPGVISGEVGRHVTHERCLKLGMAAGAHGRVGVGSCGGEAARVIADIIACGANAAGADTLRFDGGVLSCASYCAETHAVPLTVFVKQYGERGELTFLDKNGAPITHDIERKLISASADASAVPARVTGGETRLGGVFDA